MPNIETDKIIQYEMISKGSENVMSNLGGVAGISNLHNNNHSALGGAMGAGSGPGGHYCTNNSIGVSGTPTENVSNYFNSQTYYV